MVSVSKTAVGVAAALSSLVLPLHAQVQSYPDDVVSTRSSAGVQEGELEQLLAPVALYPDALLSQVLMASTYPLEVVEAARWRQSRPQWEPERLEQAVREEDWDPSVKSLVAFPTVLDMMNDRISWTARLGDAFLAQQDVVMRTVQDLRERARVAGNLESTPQQTVIREAGATTVIRIEPARPDIVYVPTYNPVVVYGPWRYPAYEPFYWQPAGYVTAGVFGFTAGFVIGHALWGGFDWYRHRPHVVSVPNYNRFWRGHYAGGPWVHNPVHRRGIYYPDAHTARQFSRGEPGRHFAPREQFRPRADAGRRDLSHIDRTPFSERGPTGGWQGGRLGGNTPAGGRGFGAETHHGPGRGSNPGPRSDATGAPDGGVIRTGNQVGSRFEGGQGPQPGAGPRGENGARGEGWGARGDGRGHRGEGGRGGDGRPPSFGGGGRGAGGQVGPVPGPSGPVGGQSGPVGGQSGPIGGGGGRFGGFNSGGNPGAGGGPGHGGGHGGGQR